MPSMNGHWHRLFATRLELPTSTAGRLTKTGELDYFRIVVASTGTLTVESSGNLDTVGRLYGPAPYAEPKENDDGGVDMNFRILKAVSPGTYYVQVRAYDETSTGDYVLHAEFSPDPP